MRVEKAIKWHILVVGLVISLLSFSNTKGSQFPFDGLFLINPYKPLIVEACELLEDLHELGTLGQYKDRLAATDILVGRTVRLMSSLIKQSKKDPARHQDAVDLVDILDKMQDAYQQLDTFGRYEILFPLLTDMQHKLTQTYL